MVNDCKDTIISIRRWKIDDEIHSDCFPYSQGDFIWFQWNLDWRLDFGGLTSSASFDVHFDEFCDSGPPIFSCDEFDSFPLSWMSHYTVMELLHYFASHILVVWYINQSFVKEQSVFVVPIL